MISSPEAYLGALREGREDWVSGLVGRVLRGRCEADFERLSLDPLRRLVFLLGPDGLARLLACRGRDRLRALGYPDDWIDELVAGGTRFRLVVFPREGRAVAATWEGLLEEAAGAYPEVAAKLKGAQESLARTAYPVLEQAAGRDLAAVYSRGRGSPGYFDLAALEEAPGEPWQVRAFLFHELHVNELFAGDGYTRDPGGGPRLREYLTRNLPLASIPGLVQWDLSLHDGSQSRS